eukprot:GHVS01010493.1.p2 GENE.GHVS01010493.1~~GHVS01010493.1.p2  ORF type:complete len:129 (-),score=27.09 GHVS01010493.1:651-1037(-)
MSALAKQLKAGGVSNRLTTLVRAEIFKALLEQLSGEEKAVANNPVNVPDCAVLINSLIEEYLSTVGYHCTLQTFTAETGYSRSDESTSSLLERDLMSADLHIPDNRSTRSLPLLCLLVDRARSAGHKA